MATNRRSCTLWRYSRLRLRRLIT